MPVLSMALMLHFRGRPSSHMMMVLKVDGLCRSLPFLTLRYPLPFHPQALRSPRFSRASIGSSSSSELPPAVSRSCWRLKSRSHAVSRVPGNSCTDPVVSTDWLSDRLGDVCILDVRGNVLTKSVEHGVEKSQYMALYEDYLEGHIPGAVFFNWVRDGVDHCSDIPVQLTNDTNEFVTLMEGKGVSAEKPVVVYDCGDGLLAPRIWWTLVMHGHPSVFVLDGGWKKWTGEGREIDINAPCPLKIYEKFEPREVDFVPRVTSAELLHLISEEQKYDAAISREGKVKIIDARNQAQFSGSVRRSKHAGRIPGAINIPWKHFLQPSGLYKSIEEQRNIFLKAGLNPNEPTRLIAYCNGGVASCTILLAWSRVGGLGYWANYDGSWNEWGNSDDFPKEAQA